jgi:asparagine synthase (glutamine-hydrolysing)
MCGIAGIASLDGSPLPGVERIRDMCATLVHRGPDDEGIDVRDGVALGMRRLAIIDTAGGRQPLWNEDRSVRVVFNGEIYNFAELRRDLEKRGHRFATATDGEVIVHLWEERGPALLDDLNGMFAIAIHDLRRRKLLLARDRVGIKPLFFAAGAHHLVFGSEIKALLASGLVEPELDVDALGQFVSWEYVPAPRTLFRGVHKLDAAECLEVDLADGRFGIRSWWDVPEPDAAAGTRSEAEWAERVEEKLGACVRRQLVSDVPLGAFLSGGVDSSLVVSAMEEPQTFSIGFREASYDELPWSRAVAEHLGTRHETEVIEPEALDRFDELMRFMEDPIADVSIFPTFMVSRLARRSVTVALTGDGGDELFGGYETYLAELWSRPWHLLPGRAAQRGLARAVRALPPRPEKKGPINAVRRFVEGLGHDRGLHHARWRCFAGEALRAELFTPEALAGMETPVGEHVLRLFERAGARSATDRCLYVDLKSYLVDNCLVKVDRMSMACSLEARVPFLDHELVELAFRVPAELKVRAGATKVLLKTLAERHVPREAVRRPKQGFSIPMKSWLQGRYRPLLEELLSPDEVRRTGLLRVEAVERLKREHLANRENHAHVLWALMVFQDWRRRWGA